MDSDDDILFMGEYTAPTLVKSDTKLQSSTKRQARHKPQSVVKKQRSSCWVQSAFEDCFKFPEDSKTTENKKRPRSVKSSEETITAWKSVIKNDDLWYERHAPHKSVDLAVHKKKIEEVDNWLHVNLSKRDRCAPILLLTGPAGSGKTACLKTLCHEKLIEIQEWTNPIMYTEKDIFDEDAVKSEYSSVGGYRTKSQLVLFEEFLLRANKYPTLQIFGGDTMTRKVVLVEEFPNVFFRDASVFHSILRRYRKTGRCPLVFIVTDSAGGESNERLLFPKDFQADLNVFNISFNPIAPTMMSKILDRIVSTECKSGNISAPTKEVIDGLGTACSGDIRGAINALQFACLMDTSDLSSLKQISKKSTVKTFGKKNASKSKPTDKDQPVGVGGKDSSIFLFRALGKILYCKREEDVQSTSQLPLHLVHHHRASLSFNPEEIVERSCMSADFFNDYLHQNYLDFYYDLNDVVRASDYFSVSDTLTQNWSSRSVMNPYASSIATRGLIHSNSGKSTTKQGSGGWKPLHKPQWYDARKKMRNNTNTAQDLFKTSRSAPRDLVTELLPYLTLINIPMHNPEQIKLLQEVVKFEKSVTRPMNDRLGETDVNMLPEESQIATSTLEDENNDDVDDLISNSQNKVQNTEDDEPEIIIEEFDD